jgi:hypothetical protein
VGIRFGLQYGDGANFGYGAIDDTDEKNRNSASVSLEPELALTKVFYPVKCTGSSLLWALLIF